MVRGCKKLRRGSEEPGSWVSAEAANQEVRGSVRRCAALRIGGSSVREWVTVMGLCARKGFAGSDFRSSNIAKEIRK